MSYKTDVINWIKDTQLFQRIAGKPVTDEETLKIEFEILRNKKRIVKTKEKSQDES